MKETRIEFDFVLIEQESSLKSESIGKMRNQGRNEKTKTLQWLYLILTPFLLSSSRKMRAENNFAYSARNFATQPPKRASSILCLIL